MCLWNTQLVLSSYPQWQSLPQAAEEPGVEVQEQNIPSSSTLTRFLTFFVRYISYIYVKSLIKRKQKYEYKMYNIIIHTHWYNDINHNTWKGYCVLWWYS